MRYLVLALAVVLLIAGGAWYMAGRATPPIIEIRQPMRQLGQTGTLDVAVTAPPGSLRRLDVRLEQGSNRFSLFALPGNAESKLTQEATDRVTVTRPVGKQQLPELKSGPARIVVLAERTLLFGLRSVQAETARDVVVRLEPPRVSVLSTHHYVNHGG